MAVTGRTLVATAAAVTATAVVGGIAGPDSPWYRQLRKAVFQPPPITFPIVWTALYADIAVTSAATIDGLHASGRDEEAARYAAVLGGNLVLNAGWTWLFFGVHKPLVATVECAALAASSADLVRRSAALDRRLAIALVPYAAWTAFATVLSATITWLNRR